MGRKKRCIKKILVHVITSEICPVAISFHVMGAVSPPCVFWNPKLASSSSSTLLFFFCFLKLEMLLDMLHIHI